MVCSQSAGKPLKASQLLPDISCFSTVKTVLPALIHPLEQDSTMNNSIGICKEIVYGNSTQNSYLITVVTLVIFGYLAIQDSKSLGMGIARPM